MKIKKGLKIGLIVGSSIISVGGAVMMFVGGMPTYNATTFQYDADGRTETGITTKQYGIGLFNFDNTSQGSQFSERVGAPKQTYNEVLDKVNKATFTEKKELVNHAKSLVEDAKADTLPEPFKEWNIVSAESYLSSVNAMMAMPTMHGLAITGIVFLPIGLLILIGSLFIKTKAKITD